MSWNNNNFSPSSCISSTSSWGRELKFSAITSPSSSFTVDLFVRSWVEIASSYVMVISSSSTSSWGRELKYIPAGTYNLSNAVDLFVRSWVEIFYTPSKNYPAFVDLFVRSWVEISTTLDLASAGASRPLREVVSWNFITSTQKVGEIVDLFVRSWVEIILILWNQLLYWCRPLREVVSWNMFFCNVVYSYGKSTSSWGRELKLECGWNE